MFPHAAKWCGARAVGGGSYKRKAKTSKSADIHENIDWKCDIVNS